MYDKERNNEIGLIRLQNYFEPNMTPKQINAMSALALAHIGDAVFELLVRSRLCIRGGSTNGKLHHDTVAQVCAGAQAALADRMLPALTGEEAAYYRRGRNAHPHGIPKNATPAQYAKATGVEALFGAIFLDGGFPNAVEAVSNFLDTKPEISGAAVIKDPKTELQEYFQRQGMDVPCYETMERTGPEHALNFKVRLAMGNKILAEAWGASTKEAEFKAAEEALKKIRA